MKKANGRPGGVTRLLAFKRKEKEKELGFAIQTR